jgi:hypothetical protein
MFKIFEKNDQSWVICCLKGGNDINLLGGIYSMFIELCFVISIFGNFK